MNKLILDINTGKCCLNKSLLLAQSEEVFQKSKFFLENKIEPIGKQFILRNVDWFDRQFNMWFIFQQKKSFNNNFIIQLIALDSGFMACKGDWNKRANTDMLKKDFYDYKSWLSKKILLQPIFEKVTEDRLRVFWAFNWGKLTIEVDACMEYKTAIYLELTI